MNVSVIIDAINDEIVARGCFIVEVSVSKDNDIIITIESEKGRIEERLLKNKLRAIFRKHSVGSKSSLKESERKTIRQAKKFPKLKKDIKRIEGLLVTNKMKLFEEIIYFIFSFCI